MLDQVLNQIAPIFTSPDTLCWVEKYCGLSRIAKREVHTRDGGFEKQSYPVSCKIGADDCWNKGRYKDLVPDSKYASIVYWEQVGDMPITNMERSKRMHKRVDVELNLITWLNLQKLGKDQCSFCTEAFLDLIANLNGAKVDGISNYISNISVEVRGMNSLKTTQSIINQYSYGSVERLFYFPYEFCSFKVRLSWIVNTACIPEIECGEPIECIEL